MKQIFYAIGLCLILLPSCKSIKTHQVDYAVIPPVNKEGLVNMIVEIPTGTTAKYEMNKSLHILQMDSLDGEPRYIDYLGYPGNYGMVPNTILPKHLGGDGDPLDIIVLGPAVSRGSIIQVKLIGVLELQDDGEQDDKLIAINPATKWVKVTDINDLDKLYPGTKEILATFFQNYKGSGKMKLIGWSNTSKAEDILRAAIDSKTAEN